MVPAIRHTQLRLKARIRNTAKVECTYKIKYRYVDDHNGMCKCSVAASVATSISPHGLAYLKRAALMALVA
jgi:hypothetical protein